MIKFKKVKYSPDIKATADIQKNGACEKVAIEIKSYILNCKSDLVFFNNNNTKDLTIAVSDSFTNSLITVDPKLINFNFVVCDRGASDEQEYLIYLRFSDKTQSNVVCIRDLEYKSVKTLLSELMCLTKTEDNNFYVEEFNQIITEKLQQLHFEFTEFLAKNNAELIE